MWIAFVAAVALLILGGSLVYLYLSGRLSWPFAIRYSDAAFADPQLRQELALALSVMAGGVLLAAVLIAVGVVMRRWLIVIVGVLVAVGVMPFVRPTVNVLTVEAFPTTYYRSPTGYSAASIVRGADLFATHCAACHGRQGRGDGPAGRFFRTKPSDLTADHVYAHTDGDLYWWIENGIRDVMPDFRTALGEEARWNVIDFVRANADAARISQSAGKVTNAGYRAPDFSAQCRDRLAFERPAGRIVHLVVAGSAERLRQLAALDLGSDVTTIAITLGDPPIAGRPACRSDDLIKALALYRDGAPVDGTEFLIDASGMLRAMWHPGGKPNWSEGDLLKREIAAIRANPRASRPIGSHLHAR